MTPFLKSEAGAITVDWVVITGIAVACGVAVLNLMGPGFSTMSGNVQGELEQDKIVSVAANTNLTYIPNDWATFNLWRDTASTWENGDIVSAMADMGGNNPSAFMENTDWNDWDKYAGLQSALIANGGNRPNGWVDASDF